MINTQWRNTTNDKRYADLEIFLTASGADEEAETIKSQHAVEKTKQGEGEEGKAGGDKRGVVEGLGDGAGRGALQPRMHNAATRSRCFQIHEHI